MSWSFVSVTACVSTLFHWLNVLSLFGCITICLFTSEHLDSLLLLAMTKLLKTFSNRFLFASLTSFPLEKLSLRETGHSYEWDCYCVCFTSYDAAKILSKVVLSFCILSTLRALTVPHPDQNLELSGIFFFLLF